MRYTTVALLAIFMLGIGGCVSETKEVGAYSPDEQAAYETVIPRDTTRLLGLEIPLSRIKSPYRQSLIRAYVDRVRSGKAESGVNLWQASELEIAFDGATGLVGRGKK